MDDYQPNSGLTSTQKTGFVLLLLFGVLAISLGFLQMRNTIFNPFAIRLSQEELSFNTLFDEETRLQSIDTDHDGLNDWEELNFYETSPYLPDTDSDGIEDKVELDNGTNPLCPEGENCGGSVGDVGDIGPQEENTGESPFVTPGEGVVTPSDIVDQSGLTDELSQEDIATILEDPNAIRELLMMTGELSEDEVMKFDDETLLSLAQELWASQVAEIAKEEITTSTILQ